MSSITKEIASARSAVDHLIRVTLSCDANWTEPRAPGKWSPSQIVEHVARGLEESAKDMTGEDSKLPRLPRPLRFLVRHLVFNRVIRQGRFPKGRANPAMDPDFGPHTPDEGRQRLEAAWEVFERLINELAERGGTATVSGLFGRVLLTDAVRFNEFHVRHHLLQMPGT